MEIDKSYQKIHHPTCCSNTRQPNKRIILAVYILFPYLSSLFIIHMQNTLHQGVKHGK